MAEKVDPKKPKHTVLEGIKKNVARDAARGVVEEFFNDVYVRRREIYVANFFRGIFFGFGSVLGGTILIALLIWLLSQVGTLVPFLSDFIQQILDALSRGKQ